MIKSRHFAHLAARAEEMKPFHVILTSLLMSLPYHRGQVTNHMSQRGWGLGSKEHRVAETNKNLLEDENDAKWAELGEKVSLLKELGLEINQEVKSQNRLLDGMSDSFGTAASLFTNTIAKLGNMLTSGSSNHMYYLIAFVVIIFIVLYFLMGRK